MYHDMVCRKCGNAEETLQHIMNCGCQDEINVSVLYSDSMDFPYEQKLIFIAIDLFPSRSVVVYENGMREMKTNRS